MALLLSVCLYASRKWHSSFLLQEIALLQQSERTASVESVTPMDLLVIGRSDFERIFLNMQDGKDPEHITFCKENIRFLEHFPMEKCREVPRECMFHYFRWTSSYFIFSQSQSSCSIETNEHISIWVINTSLSAFKCLIENISFTHIWVLCFTLKCSSNVIYFPDLSN